MEGWGDVLEYVTISGQVHTQVQALKGRPLFRPGACRSLRRRAVSCALGHIKCVTFVCCVLTDTIEPHYFASVGALPLNPDVPGPARKF